MNDAQAGEAALRCLLFHLGFEAREIAAFGAGVTTQDDVHAGVKCTEDFVVFHFAGDEDFATFGTGELAEGFAAAWDDTDDPDGFVIVASEGEAHSLGAGEGFEAFGEFAHSGGFVEREFAAAANCATRLRNEFVDIDGRLFVGVEFAEHLESNGESALTTDHFQPDFGHVFDDALLADGGARLVAA